MAVLGDAIAVLLGAGVVALAWVTWRRPFLGLGFLVAGMAFHNFVLMVLVRLGTASVLVRGFQAWKEALLLVLLAAVALRAWHVRREGRSIPILPLDWVAAAFLVVMVVYLVMPNEVTGGHATVQQRLAAFRLVALMPLLYMYGRVFRPAGETDLRTVAWLIVGAGAVVGAFGLVELWLVPTRDWLGWGVNQFSALLGFHYNGPQGLPENFFQTLGPDAYLRRMVSTYISPLGIAYTGLLVFPLAVMLIEGPQARLRRVVAAAALALLVLGIMFSVTRLALVALVGEAVLVASFLRRPWQQGLVVLLLVGVLAVLFGYPAIGPKVDGNLNAINPQGGGGIVSAGDPSLLEHIRTVTADLRVAITHPLGQGLGSSGSPSIRFGGTGSSADYALGESAVLTMYVDTGVVGGTLYVIFYLFGLFMAARGLVNRRQTWESALPMVAFVGGLALIPIALTSDIWGDLSVTFLFWWAVGSAASLAFSRVHVAQADTGATAGARTAAT